MADRIAKFFVPIVVLISILSLPYGRYGSGAFAGICLCKCCDGAHYCLSLCTGSCNADVNHGRHRERCERRVLIKEAKVIEEMEKVNVLVIDKTGTITEGKPLKSVKTFDSSVNEDTILMLAAHWNQAVNIRWQKRL